MIRRKRVGDRDGDAEMKRISASISAFDRCSENSSELHLLHLVLASFLFLTCWNKSPGRRPACRPHSFPLGTMLPMWFRAGKPIVSISHAPPAQPKSLRPLQTIPLPNKQHIAIPLLPVILLLLALGYLLRPAAWTHTGGLSSFRVDPSLFPPVENSRPSYLPAPVPPKKSGMKVPNSVHYVYGLKPVAKGEKAEELPYYAYLAMRSAMINLKPSTIYL